MQLKTFMTIIFLLLFLTSPVIAVSYTAVDLVLDDTPDTYTDVTLVLGGDGEAEVTYKPIIGVSDYSKVLNVLKSGFSKIFGVSITN